MHIEDIADTRKHHHLIIGHGAIDFAPVFDAMVRLGYCRDISLELYPYVDTPVEAGLESLQRLQPMLQLAGLSYN